MTIFLIIVFFVICLILGYIASRSRSGEGYFIANRNLGTFVSTATITASFIGANTLLVYTAFVFMFGISAFWTFIGYMIGFYIFGFFGVYLKKKADKKKYYTLSDYFHDRYGKKMALVATFAVFIIYFGSLINQYIGGAKVLSEISGWSYEIALVLVASVILAYLIMGGFKAVVKTDAFQYTIILILPMVLIFSISEGVHVPVEHWNIFNAGLMNILAFFFYGLFSVFIYSEFWQRASAARDNKTVKKAFTLAGISYVFIGLLFTYIGMVARSVFPGSDPDIAALNSFTQLIPESLLIVTMVLLFAIIMSSADTVLFVLAMNLSQDIMNRNRNLTPEKGIMYTRFSFILFSVIAVAIAIIYPKMAEIVIVYVSLGIGLAPLIIITWLKKSVNVKAMIIAFIATVATVLALVLGFGYIHPGLGFIAILESFAVYFIAGSINRQNTNKSDM